MSKTKEVQNLDTDIEVAKDFDNDVQEFKNVEREMFVQFIKGLIQLGEVLKRQRDKWKPHKRWSQYLNTIDKTLPYANQCIRIYEYSLKNMSTLLKVDLTNWHKVNMFLALSDEAKNEMAEQIDGQETTTEEFMDKIGETKEDNEEIVTPDDGGKWQDLVSSASFSDLPFMAKELLKQLNKNGHNFSKNCLIIVEGFLGLGKANKELTKANFKALTVEERKFWKKQIVEQLDMLTKLLK
jgi:hypothetical protein